jgi:hypothetical protein
VHVSNVSDNLLRLLSWRKSAGRDGSPSKIADESPLRAELFSLDQLERHAKTLASSHRLASGQARDKLLPRLDENERILIETYDLVTVAAAQNRRIEPAAEWLLDNFYLLEEQMRAIHLRRAFCLCPSRWDKNWDKLKSGCQGFTPASNVFCPRRQGISPFLPRRLPTTGNLETFYQSDSRPGPKTEFGSSFAGHPHRAGGDNARPSSSRRESTSLQRSPASSAPGCGSVVLMPNPVLNQRPFRLWSNSRRSHRPTCG